MRERLVHLFFGGLFGVALAKNGAADFDAMMRMFRFEDFHLFGVAIVTTLASMIGLGLVQRHRRIHGMPRYRVTVRNMHRGSVLGALIFGVGWAVSGTCPGTAVVQAGQGHFIAFATIMGIFIGSWSYERINRRVLRWALPTCE